MFESIPLDNDQKIRIMMLAYQHDSSIHPYEETYKKMLHLLENYKPEEKRS